jgi:hypothetical protein
LLIGECVFLFSLSTNTLDDEKRKKKEDAPSSIWLILYTISEGPDGFYISCLGVFFFVVFFRGGVNSIRGRGLRVFQHPKAPFTLSPAF